MAISAARALETVRIVVLEDESVRDEALPYVRPYFAPSQYRSDEPFAFAIHRQWHAMKRTHEPYRVDGTIESPKSYEEAKDFVSKELNGPTLLIVDCHYPLVNSQDESTELRNALGDLKSKDQEPGLYLLLKAIENPEWHGLALVSSGVITRESLNREGGVFQRLKRIRDDVARAREDGAGRVEFDATGKNFGSRDQEDTQQVLEVGIERFLEHFGGVKGRLQPNGARLWFKRNDRVPPGDLPHDYDPDPRYDPIYVAYFQGAWSQIDRSEIPGWWRERTPAERLAIHNSLKGFVGSYACAHWNLNRSRNPNCGSLALITAAHCPQPMRWLREVDWAQSRSRSQRFGSYAPFSKCDGKALFEAFCRFVGGLAPNVADRTETTLRGVTLKPTSLELNLSFPTQRLSVGWVSDRLEELSAILGHTRVSRQGNSVVFRAHQP